MEPRIITGDIIATRPVESTALTKGDVITTRDPDKAGTTRTHRFVERNSAGLIVTKGDANREQDSTPVTDADVLGQGVLRIPFVGRPAAWLTAGDYGKVTLALGVLAALILGTGTRLKPDRIDGPSHRGGSGFSPPPRRTNRQPSARHRRAGAAIAAMVTASLDVIAPGTGAAFSAATTNASTSLSAATSFTPYRDAVTADSPLLHWRLDETSGTAATDAAGGNDPGTVRNGYTWATTGALASETRSTALSLTNNGYITENNNTTHGSNPSTSEIWVRTTSTQGGALLTFGQSGGTTANSNTTTDRVLYFSPDGKIRFGVRGVVIASNAALNDGGWHHVAATYTNASGGMRLYVDGAQQTATGTATPRFTTAGFWRAGGEALAGWPSAPTANYLVGVIDEVAIYSGVALSAARIQAHYAAGRTP